ncbi:MAG: hypothetical protein AAF447_22445, partial [Myxococcota bacterium]
MSTVTPAVLGARARSGSRSRDDPDALDFLRRRVGQFGLANGIVGYSALVARLAMGALVGDASRGLTDPSLVTNL